MLYIGCPWFKNTGAFVDTQETQPTSQAMYVGTEIQANCNFEGHVYYCNYLLGFNVVATLGRFLQHPITSLYFYLVTSFCLVISVASYAKIFCTLRYHQAQVRDQQQLSQTNALNMARFRKAVYSALWVQLVLVVSYVPVHTLTVVITHTKKYSLLLVVTWSVAVPLLYLNSTLNPFLYCWKISEVRQAVKQTIRQALC